MPLIKKILKFFILIALVQSSLEINFTDAIKLIYDNMSLRHLYNEHFKSKGMPSEDLKIQEGFKFPSSMLPYYDRVIVDNLYNYVLAMQNVVSLSFSTNQNLLMEKLKNVIYKDDPQAKNGLEFLKPKIGEFLAVIELFFDGGVLNSFNDYFKFTGFKDLFLNKNYYEIFVLEPCETTPDGRPNSETYEKIIAKFLNQMEQYYEASKILIN